MGSLIIQLAQQKSDECIVKAGVEGKGPPLVGRQSSTGISITDKGDEVINGGEVVIDFSVPDASMKYLKICTTTGSPFVTGITGFTAEQMDEIQKASLKIPVFYAPNMSVGVNLFFEIIRFAVKLLREYETEIMEIHHRFKKDAPSGTAKKISDIICSVSGRKPDEVVRYGRQGITGTRTQDEIGMHSLRMGDVVGEHYVYFAGKGEIIEVAHRCYNRESFALGALKAAGFIKNKPADMYDMEDLIKETINA